MLSTLIALTLYLYYTATDGDYLNDWLTRFHGTAHDTVLALGKIIAATCGC